MCCTGAVSWLAVCGRILWHRSVVGGSLDITARLDKIIHSHWLLAMNYWPDNDRGVIICYVHYRFPLCSSVLGNGQSQKLGQRQSEVRYWRQPVPQGCSVDRGLCSVLKSCLWHYTTMSSIDHTTTPPLQTNNVIICATDHHRGKIGSRFPT